MKNNQKLKEKNLGNSNQKGNRNVTKKLSNYVLCFFLISVCSIFLFSNSISFFLYQVIGSWMPGSDDDFKLKFVSSNVDEDAFLYLNLEVEKPIEIKNIEQNGEIIVITSNEKSVVKSPIDCNIDIVEKIIEGKIKRVVVAKQDKFVVELWGVEFIGVVGKQRLKAGEIIGTLENDKLYLKVTLDQKIMTATDLKGVLW